MTRSARGTREYPGTHVAQKRGLNRADQPPRVGTCWWPGCSTRPRGRLEFVPAAYTSQRCSHCGHVAPENRKSQAVFQCVACGAGPCNADVNAARNIAAGRAVTARGDLGTSRSVNRFGAIPRTRCAVMFLLIWVVPPAMVSERDVRR